MKRVDKALPEKSKKSKIFKNPGFLGPFPVFGVWPSKHVFGHILEKFDATEVGEGSLEAS